jgi:hypothetical protein
MNDRYMVISPDTLEAMRRAGHVAKLEVRIEKLEAALRWICGSRTVEYSDGTVQADETKMLWTYRRIAREALEGTYDERIFKDPT